MTQRIILLFVLCATAVLDLWKRAIPQWVAIGSVGIFAIYNLVWPKRSWLDIGLGMALGVFLIVVSHFVADQVGSADGWMLCTVGMVMGFIDTISIAAMGFLLAIPVGIAGSLVRKKRIDLKFSLPWLPCLLAAFSLFWFLEGWGNGG